MTKSQIHQARYLKFTDVQKVFALYQINFKRYLVPHHRDPRLDAIEALEAIQCGRP